MSENREGSQPCNSNFMQIFAQDRGKTRKTTRVTIALLKSNSEKSNKANKNFLQLSLPQKVKYLI